MGTPWTGRFHFVGVYSKGFPVDSSPCTSLIFLLCPRLLVRVGFLGLRGRRAVGPIPEGHGLMAFSLALFGSQRFFFTIANAARSLGT